MRQAFARYELHAVPIGRVIEEPVIRARYRGELVCEVPGRALADDAPRYVLPAAPPAELERAAPSAWTTWRPALPDGATLLELLASPNVRSRRPVWRRYDHMNGTNTLVGPGDGDAAVLRVKGTPRALALSHRRARPAGCAGSAPGRRRGRAGGRAQRGLLGRGADRHHRLPELRLAGDAGGLLAAGRGGGRDGRRVSCARPADRVGQRQPLQRDAGRPDPADPGGRHGGPARGPITPGADALARGRRDLAAGRSGAGSERAGGLRAGLAERPARGDAAAGDRRRRQRSCGCWSRWPATASWPARTTCRSAGWGWPWRAWRSPPIAVRRSTCRRAPRSGQPPRSSASAPDASWWLSRRTTGSALRTRRCERAFRPNGSGRRRVGSCAIQLPGPSLQFSVEALASAWETPF